MASAKAAGPVRDMFKVDQRFYCSARVTLYRTPCSCGEEDGAALAHVADTVRGKGGGWTGLAGA